MFIEIPLRTGRGLTTEITRSGLLWVRMMRRVRLPLVTRISRK
jgi:hypothetical protein